MADTPVPDADPADVEEQQRPVVEEPDGGPADLPAVPDANPADVIEQRPPAGGPPSVPIEADPADAQEQSQVVGDDEDERR